jgi:hypothetical protein
VVSFYLYYFLGHGLDGSIIDGGIPVALLTFSSIDLTKFLNFLSGFIDSGLRPYHL